MHPSGSHCRSLTEPIAHGLVGSIPVATHRYRFFQCRVCIELPKAIFLRSCTKSLVMVSTISNSTSGRRWNQSWRFSTRMIGFAVRSGQSCRAVDVLIDAGVFTKTLVLSACQKNAASDVDDAYRQRLVPHASP